MAVREDLFLRIMDLVAASGTGFAFPAQLVLRRRPTRAIDARAPQGGEAEVASWRDAKRSLPARHAARAHAEELADTLDWPPAGRRPAPRSDGTTAHATSLVVDGSLDALAYRCWPDGCPRGRTCCVGLVVEASRREVRAIDSLMDELAAAAACACATATAYRQRLRRRIRPATSIESGDDGGVPVSAADAAARAVRHPHPRAPHRPAGRVGEAGRLPALAVAARRRARTGPSHRAADGARDGLRRAAPRAARPAVGARGVRAEIAELCRANRLVAAAAG